MEMRWKHKPGGGRGILCGCNRTQEWLLPWWWERYSFYNRYPVLFCDFGMSNRARAWCQERGQVVSVSLDPALIRSRREVSHKLQKCWTKNGYSKYWDCRAAFFTKPFAMLQSPFDTSIWLDVDCEVLHSLDDLFAYSSKSPLALLPCYGEISSEFFFCPIVHNGGVVVFQHGIDIFVKQTELVLEWNHQFYAEDNVLSYLIYKMDFPVTLLPREWNWTMSSNEPNLFANIVHWNENTKKVLKISDGMKPLRDQLFGVKSPPMSARSRAISAGIDVC